MLLERVFRRKNSKPTGKAAKVLLIVGLILGIISFLQSFRDIRRYGGVDLRSRVVGARLLFAGLNPYTFEWSPGMPETRLDPVKRHPGASRTLVSPATLFLYATLMWLPYQAQRYLWFMVEWAALVGALILLARTTNSRRGRFLFLLVSIYFFVGGAFWRLHVERGQYYVYTLLLLSLGIFFCLSRHRNLLLAGLFFGLAAALRLPFLVMALPLWIGGMRKPALTMIGAFLLAVLCTIPVSGLEGWKSFFELSNTIGYIQVDPSYEERRYGPAITVPATAEGVELTRAIIIPTGDTTLSGVYRIVTRYLPGSLQQLDIVEISKACAVLLLILAGALALMIRGRVTSKRYLLTFALVLALDLEFFLPLRWAYADIVYLAPLALVSPILADQRSPAVFLTLVMLGLFLGYSANFDQTNGSFLRSFLVIGAINLYIAVTAWMRFSLRDRKPVQAD